MALADVDIGVGPTLASRSQARVGSAVLLGLLCVFTLTTLDGGDIWPRIISAVLLLCAAIYFLVPPGLYKFRLGLPGGCLIGMTGWGILQTLCFPLKIPADGWNGVLFWFTAAVIAIVGASVFFRPETAEQFRLGFVQFASGIATLDLLQQATHSDKFYWWIASRYHLVYGPFGHWNSFAQFIELSLPITLWVALSQGKPKFVYMFLSAIQLSAVISVGTRAGTVLVILEALAISVIAFLRFRNRMVLFGGLAGVGLVLVLIFVAGFGAVRDQFAQNDQLPERSKINQSSWAMLAKQPVTGWGLNSYASVYRMFALYDDGNTATRAHSDWLQLAVEGGIPFAALMGAMFVWSIRPAYQSGWGIGLIAVGLHAMVDSPFAQLGVCGWYFALVSMMSYQRAFQQMERDKPVRESIY